MGAADLARLDAGGPLARAVASQTRIWTPVQNKLFADWGGPQPEDFVAFLHDPLTVLALIDPSPLRFETLRIVPTVESGILRTREAPADSTLGVPMRVATAVDARAAREAIVARIVAV
jgi:hypothetical protein